ncbi:MAG: DUF4430 domain-containing protein [Clostridiales bacterium]|jgi:hypothetical protein|nr:DUF4430 domain-containing protein [Clostridiales bacterium]
MNKKIIAIVAVILLLVAIYWVYSTFISPKGEEGKKQVTIHVVISKEDIDQTFEYTTEHEFLYDLLKEKEKELGASFQSYDFGVMVTGMMNYVADESQQEFFHIAVNGEDATTGPQEIPLKDGDVYKFELKNW